MKCIILCAGYATRLYPLTLDKPKPLLPVKGKSLLDYTIEKLESIKEIDEIFIVTNDKFYEDFVKWKEFVKTTKEVKIINDRTKSNDDRLGGLGDLGLVLEEENIHDDIFVIAGDNLFDFDLTKFIDFFKIKKANTIGLYNIKDINQSKNFGILEISSDGKIISFVEKPMNPKSTLISTALYLYTKNELDKINEYLKSDGLKEGPGYLIPYFLGFQDVYGFVFEGNWWDIGTKEVYEEVNNDNNFRN